MMAPSKSLRRTCVVITCISFCCFAAGCASSPTDFTEAGHRSSGSGISFKVPAGWHRVPLVNLPGADVPLEIASFNARGGVHTICDPHSIVSQIPAGGALVQILAESGASGRGAGAVGQVKDLRQFPHLKRPFHLGHLQRQECGESYPHLAFRLGGRLFGLRVWTAPTGASPAVRDQIEGLMDSLRADPGAMAHTASSQVVEAPPVGPRTVGFRALRRAILRGAAADFTAGTGVGPPRFEQCLQSNLRGALDKNELESLIGVYRRPGGQQFTAQALNALAAPLGDRCGGRRFVPEMISASMALRYGSLEGTSINRLVIGYGPYVGVSCQAANSPSCDRVGIDFVLKKEAVRVTASIAGRRVKLRTPGLHNRISNRDWVGFLSNVGMARKGSPFYIPDNGRANGVWDGNPPVYLPVRITATYADGRKLTRLLRHIFLSPGFG